MVEDESFENEELLKEAGFKIDEVITKNDSFKVKVQYPDYDQTRKTFTFSMRERWLEDAKFVKNGEILEMPRWKHHIMQKIEKELESSTDLKDEVLESVGSEEGSELFKE